MAGSDPGELPERQRRLFAFIERSIGSHGRAPTTRQMCRHLGVRSAELVQHHLHALERRGLIELEGETRCIAMTRQADADVASRARRRVPVLGTVPAGGPTFAFESLEDYLELHAALAPAAGGLFALRVQGDSMCGAGIHEGDYVLVRRQETAGPEDIVVALVDGEVTVKRFFPEDGRIRLEPANDRQRPILVDPDTQSFRMIGKVVGLYRRVEKTRVRR